MEGDRSSKKNVPLARLPSLIGQGREGRRDLALGGMTLGGAVKRKFVPIIPPDDAKKPKVVSYSEQERTNNRECNRDRGRGRGRGQGGRGRGRGENIVYQKSIFEEITTEKKVRPGMCGSYYNSSYSSGTQSHSRKVAVKEEIMDAAEADEEKNKLYCDDFIDDGNLTTMDPSLFPLLLSETQTETKAEVKKDLEEKKIKDDAMRTPAKIKQEPGERETEAMDVLENDKTKVADYKNKGADSEPKSPKPKVILPWKQIDMMAENREHSIGDFLEDKKLCLIQLPDILPGFPSTDNIAPATSSVAAVNSKQAAGKETEPVNPSCMLGDFSEGVMGKLRIRRSGNMELILGNVVFEGSALPTSFLQEVVLCEVDSDSTGNKRTGDMCILGQVSEKINLVPNLDAALKTLRS